MDKQTDILKSLHHGPYCNHRAGYECTCALDVTKAALESLIEAAKEARVSLHSCIDALDSEEQSDHDALEALDSALARIGVTP